MTPARPWNFHATLRDEDTRLSCHTLFTTKKTSVADP